MYINEDNVLDEAKAVMEKSQSSGVVPLDAYKKMAKEYETLLSEIKFITKISDRLQNKLNGINENLLEQTIQLENAQKVIMQQNDELKVSKDQLERKVIDRTKELQKANNDLKVSNLELDTFVYRASHDIKGPLASIMGVCNVAMMERRDEEVLAYFRMLLGVSTQLQNKLNRLLDVNNVKHLVPQFGSWPLAELLDTSIDTLKDSASAPYIHIVSKFPPSTVVHTDPEIFRIMLDNVLEYALKNLFPTPHADSRVTVNVIYEKNLQIFISYQGEVIPPELSSEIFKMFYRTNNNATLTGIELYTSSLAAEKLKGRVELISSSLKETMFSIFISQ